MMVKTITATTDTFTNGTHPSGDTIQDGLGLTPGIGATDMVTTTITTTWMSENSETPGSGGEWMEMSTSTTLTDGLSTATTTTSTSGIHPTGELMDGTGTGPDMTTTTPETATASSTTPGTHGDTTWTGTPRMVTTTTASTVANTSGIQPS